MRRLLLLLVASTAVAAQPQQPQQPQQARREQLGECPAGLARAEEDGACVLSFSTKAKAEVAVADFLPQLPLRWRGKVRVTQHQVDPGLDYPPRVTLKSVIVDREARLAVVETLEGAAAGERIVRDFARGEEWRELEGRCERSPLLEAMPEDSFPAAEDVRPVGFGHWVWDQSAGAGGIERAHLFVEKRGVRRVELEHVSGALEVTRLSTFEVDEVEEVDAKAAAAAVAAATARAAEAGCVRNAVGWPWAHLVHTFVRV